MKGKPNYRYSTKGNSTCRAAAPAILPAEAPPAPVCDGNSTLAEFFNHWFLPVVLTPMSARPKTVLGYREAISWWQHITGDPPLRAIDHRCCAAFAEALKISRFHRGPATSGHRLSLHRVKGILSRVRAVLSRIGPRLSPSKPTAAIVIETPCVPTVKVAAKRKPCFALDEARLIARACDVMRMPERLPEQISPPLWWRAALSVLYYTGLRTGTVFALRWRHIERDGNRWDIHVPAALVPKTSKATRIACHPQLVEVLKRMHWQRGEDHLLLPQPHSYSHFVDLHVELQQAAGRCGHECCSPQVWRRMHGQMIGEMGLDRATNVARIALDHSDSRTTMTHYVELVNNLRLQMPPLWPEGLNGDRQLMLFGPTSTPPASHHSTREKD